MHPRHKSVYNCKITFSRKVFPSLSVMILLKRAPLKESWLDEEDDDDNDDCTMLGLPAVKKRDSQ